MKWFQKHIKLFIFICVLLSIFFIYKLNNKNNFNYTALGDSFALGKNSYGGVEYGYSDYIKDYLYEKKKLNRYIKSFATDTMSIEKLQEEISENEVITLNKEQINLKHTLRESKIITLSIGLNDLLYQISITDNMTEEKLDRIISEIEKSFTQLIKQMRKYYPYQIYVIGYYHFYLSNDILNQGITKLNQLYQKQEEVIYIPIDSLFKNHPEYLSNPNDIHPNHLGYEAISKKIISKIEKNLL